MQQLPHSTTCPTHHHIPAPPPPQVHVQQLPSSSDGTGVGWYLDRIEVAGPEGQQWLFPCSAWLGKANHPAGLDGAPAWHARPCMPAWHACLAAARAYG